MPCGEQSGASNAPPLVRDIRQGIQHPAHDRYLSSPIPYGGYPGGHATPHPYNNLNQGPMGTDHYSFMHGGAIPGNPAYFQASHQGRFFQLRERAAAATPAPNPYGRRAGGAYLDASGAVSRLQAALGAHESGSHDLSYNPMSMQGACGEHAPEQTEHHPATGDVVWAESIEHPPEAPPAGNVRPEMPVKTEIESDENFESRTASYASPRTRRPAR